MTNIEGQSGFYLDELISYGERRSGWASGKVSLMDHEVSGIVGALKELRERRVEVEKYKAWAASCDEPTPPIPTWRERCQTHPEHQGVIVTSQMISARMQEEIDDLRAALNREVSR
jgi:hypothetical protein